MKLIILGLLLSSTVFAKDIQINESDMLNTVTMEGVVQVRCNSGQYPTTRMYQCYSSNIEEGNYKPFEILSDIGADSIYLFNTSNNVQKTLRINQSTMVTNKVNLWINTLTQRALLNNDDNLIMYSLMKDGYTLRQGMYVINVETSDQRRCPNGFLYYNGRQCPDRYSACRDYFYKYRYCK